MEIKLPAKPAILTAKCEPVAPTGSLYKYEWKLMCVDGNKEDYRLERAILDKNEQELKLWNLEKGTYEVNVMVTGTNADLKGEAIGVVTILPGR